MHEASAELPININISTIGYCSPTYSSQYRVGKSCLIHRFMNRSQYTEDHLSVISNSDYYGSIIAGTQWIYWGSKIIQHETKKFRLLIIEQCDFIDDHLFTPFGSESYMSRCFASIIHVDSPKTAYVCKDQVGNEWNYSREILEPGDFVVDAFVVVVDVTLTGDAAISQQQFLKKAIMELRKRKVPFVFASSKHDCEVSPENKEFVKHLLHKGSMSLKKTRCCRVETSARLNVNVHQAFLSAALLCTSSSGEINCKYFPYCPPSEMKHQSLLNSGIRSRHPDRTGTLVSIYADASSSQVDRENLRPMPRFVNRFSLVENATYDLPVEGKNATPNIVYCQFPVAISSDSSRQISLRQKNTCLLEPLLLNGACPSHICHETIETNSKFQPLHLPSLKRLQTTRIVNHPNPSPVSPNLETTESSQVKISSHQGNSTSSSQPLLMLFLSGPGASNLKAILQGQCYRDRFHLSNGHCFRIWIFDAVDPHTVQISPSKWQPHHALHPSPSAPSAFTTPPQTSFSNTSSSSGGHNNSGDSNSPSDSSTDCGSRQRQLKLSIWTVDMTIMEVSENQKCPPKSVDAVVFRAAADDPSVDEYYDEVGGDFKVELSKAFNQANLLRVPLLCIPEKVPSDLLASLLFFAKNLSLFKTIISKDCTIPCLLPEAQHTVSIPLLLRVCSSDSDSFSSVNSLNSVIEGEVTFEQVGGDDEDAIRSEASVPSQRVTVLSTQMLGGIALQSFQNLPRVAIGLDFANDFTMYRREGHTRVDLSPLVVFGTISQALEIFSHFPPTVASIRFVILHFPTNRWPKLCGEITSQLETLLNTASAALATREDEDDRNLILMLVAVSSADATRPRQLINGLAAQRTCRIWHPRAAGPCLPRCLQDDMMMDNPEDMSAPNRPFKPSLAFLHVQSEGDREFELYRQVLGGDMSSWSLSYSPDYSLTSNRTATVESRCSQGDNCEVCHSRQQELQHHSLLHRQKHQAPLIGDPPNDLLHRCSSALASSHHSSQQHQHGACCAAAVAGIGDNEYVDASFQFPVVETTFATASAQAPIIVVPSPPAPRLGNSIGGEEEKLSEHYAEFNDLFNDAANYGAIDPIAFQNRPHRPKAPTLTFSSSPPIILPPSPATHPAASSPSSPATPSTTSIVSLTPSSLITSYTSSSPDRGVIDFRPQRGLFRSCSDTPPTSTEKIGEAVPTFTPFPMILAAGRGACVVEPQEDAYESVYEEPIQLEHQRGQQEWHLASSLQPVSPLTTTTLDRSDWVRMPSLVGRFCAPLTQGASALRSEFVEVMDAPCVISPTSVPDAAIDVVSPSLSSPYDDDDDDDTIKSKYGTRRSIPTLIDSRRKNTSSRGHIFSPFPNEPVYDEALLSISPLCQDGMEDAVLDENTRNGSKHSNKLLGGLKSAFKRRGSLFRSNNRKNNAKH